MRGSNGVIVAPSSGWTGTIQRERSWNFIFWPLASFFSLYLFFSNSYCLIILMCAIGIELTITLCVSLQIGVDSEPQFWRPAEADGATTGLQQNLFRQQRNVERPARSNHPLSARQFRPGCVQFPFNSPSFHGIVEFLQDLLAFLEEFSSYVGSLGCLDSVRKFTRSFTATWKNLSRVF